MKNKIKKGYLISAGLFIAFVVWTVLISIVDVRAIGPNGSLVGFGGLNGWFHGLTGANISLYVITDWLGLVPFGVAFVFAVMGLSQWIKRKDLLKVDGSIIALGCFYIAVIAVYVFFEAVVINYRPILIGGILEASYPSSTTLLVLCVMPTAAMQLHARIRNRPLRRAVIVLIVGFCAFMVAGRLISGVHWVTDIIGGALLSAGLDLLYNAVCRTLADKK